MVELDRFVQRTIDDFPTMWSFYDPHWRSPCEVGEPVEHNEALVVPWRPIARHGADDFQGLERAFESEIHPSVKEYFGGYWSGCLEAEAEQGHVSLIQLWNIDDRDRLLENLIGHAIAQRRSKSPLSIFFACTEPGSELFLAINNTNGAIQLERPGYKPLRTVSSGLDEFLSGLNPAPPYLHPERVALKTMYRD